MRKLQRNYDSEASCVAQTGLPEILLNIYFARQFGWTLANNSNANVDAIGKDGTRYQIKGRRLTRHNQSRQLSAIRDLAGVHFDYLAGVLFSEDYQVFRAAIIPRLVIETHTTFMTRTNSHRFVLHDDVWGAADVSDVTSQLRAVAL